MLYILYKPQQNGIVKRRNKILIDMTRLMMPQIDIVLHFQREAISYACALKKYEKWHLKNLDRIEIRFNKIKSEDANHMYLSQNYHEIK